MLHVKSTTEEAFSKMLDELMLDDSLMEDLSRIYLPLAKLINTGLNTSSKTQVIGINGAQGAGKTTFSALLKVVLENQFDMRVVNFSIDDFYLSRSVRQKLAEDVHPLLITRGVPGTHDAMFCQNVLDSLCNAEQDTKTIIPRFNKALDEPFEKSAWQTFVGRPNVILFDGWFVGAVEQKETELISPINDLERDEDGYCVWRRYVNNQLRENYRPLFDKIDLLVMLKIPSFEKVYEWRLLQEKKLRLKNEDGKNLRIMTDEELRRFISHYERLTKHILKEMPDRVDMLFDVGNDHRVCL